LSLPPFGYPAVNLSRGQQPPRRIQKGENDEGTKNRAFAILDGIEAGQEDIFPDPFAADFGRRFGSSPKASERQIAEMTAAMLPRSAA